MASPMWFTAMSRFASIARCIGTSSATRSAWKLLSKSAKRRRTCQHFVECMDISTTFGAPKPRAAGYLREIGCSAPPLWCRGSRTSSKTSEEIQRMCPSRSRNSHQGQREKTPKQMGVQCEWHTRLDGKKLLGCWIGTDELAKRRKKRRVGITMEEEVDSVLS